MSCCHCHNELSLLPRLAAMVDDSQKGPTEGQMIH